MDPHPVDLVLPDEPAPVRLMNTTWAGRGGRFEALADASDARRFLVAVGRPAPAELDATHLSALHDLRDALRTLADPTTPGSPARRAAVGTINTAMAAAPAPDVLAAGGEGWTLSRVDGPSFAASLAGLARAGAAALADRSRPLRVCHAPGCGLFFVRHHQRRRWCSTGCGDRVRAARYYRRHHSNGPTDPRRGEEGRISFSV